jgi:hypothetical protein
VPHTMMMQGDPQAMDRLLELNGELDRITASDAPVLPPPAEAAPPRRLPAAARAAAAGEFGGRRREGKILLPAKP